MRSAERVSRLPLRVRLVAGFVATMLLVLTAAGGFVYWRVQYALDRRLNTELTDLARTLTPQITANGQLSADGAVLSAVDSYQVLTPDGRVAAHSPGAGSAPLIGEQTVRRALKQPVRTDIGDLLPISSRPLRVYARSVPASGPAEPFVLVVATRRSQRDEALRELLVQLFAAGLGALVVTAFVGDRLAKAALRPVERYRAQAADVASGATGMRLDIPPGRDDEITRLGRTLNDMLDSLEQALEHERRFVNDASHELRTPLTLLSSRVQLALRRPRTTEHHEAVLAEIGTDVTHLAQLTDQLLLLGLNEAPAHPAEVVDLADLVHKAAERRQLLASRESAYSAVGSLRVVATGPHLVAVGVTQLTRVVDNLLDNAELHGRPPVTVMVDGETDTVRLMVQDAGAGLDALTLSTATQRFARAPDARSRPGSGLGLSLVEGIVLRAGGELRICSRGVHESFGTPRSTPCDHGELTTVTILLSAAPSGAGGDGSFLVSS